MQFNVDFFAGYSPERINPATKNIRLKNFENHVGSTETGRKLMHYINRLLLRERICTHKSG
jgi:UDP-N-acetyl-D-mannosaminuronate dehydrogenase